VEDDREEDNREEEDKEESWVTARRRLSGRRKRM